MSKSPTESTVATRTRSFAPVADLPLAAVDLGATSGRVILGGISEGRLVTHDVARFPNVPVHMTEGPNSGLYWNIDALFAEVEAGLCEALLLSPGLLSIGIDSWAVDYGLLQRGRLVGSPRHYRDARTAIGVAEVHAQIGADELFARNGLQHLDFNTVFQLAADKSSGSLQFADHALLIPDLFASWLTGQQRTESTNASTTGLLSIAHGTIDDELMARLGLPDDLFAPLIAPGEIVGTLTAEMSERLGASTVSPTPINVTAVGSHDTASAVVAVPLSTRHSAFISSGTWSLVGVELDEPIVTEAARSANFTNEGGVDSRVRFLKNVSGLWLLSESMREWQRHSTDVEPGADLQTLLAEAAAIEREVPLFDPSDPRFTPPGDMPGRIAQWCTEHDLEPPQNQAEIVRSILESLARAYAETIAAAEKLAGFPVDTIHVVGGGSQNSLLCSLTAKTARKTVIAGPVEATAIGNLLVQARATGLVDHNASLEDLREIVRASFPVHIFHP